MPRSAGVKNYISLIRGLVTEANALNFPEGATADELNFTVDKDGLIRKRRKGFTTLYPEYTVGRTDSVIDNVLYWRAAGVLLVVITDATPATRVRVHAVNETLDFIDEFVVASARARTEIAENTNFIMITTSISTAPLFLEYNPTSEVITLSTMKIYVRDFELVDDGLGIGERPLPLSGLPTPPPLDMTDNHLYNLYNAGWYKDRRIQNIATQPFGDPIENFRTYSASGPPFGAYPSNADIVSIGVSINENGVTTFRPDELNGIDIGNTAAPRGHYVYDINDFDRDARIADKSLDGAPSTTLTQVSTIDLSSVSRFIPNVSEDVNPGV